MFAKLKTFLKQHITITSLCVLLASCASTGEDSGLGRDIDFNGSDCISIATIRDYTALDKSTLLLTGAGNRRYLVTLMSPSFELRSSMQLRFESRDGSLCPYGGDQLSFGFSDYPESIRGISRLTREQADELLVRYGKKEPEEQEDQAPPEVTGAEVEELGQIE